MEFVLFVFKLLSELVINQGCHKVFKVFQRSFGANSNYMYRTTFKENLKSGKNDD